MFLVFNKDKVCAYIVSVLTVCFLFFIASKPVENTVETGTNVNLICENIENNINNINSNMNNVTK